MKTWTKLFISWIFVVLIGFVLVFIITYIIIPPRHEIKPIPNWPFSRFLSEQQRLIRYHPVDYASPIDHIALPQHPYMAANYGNNMHNDASMSDTSAASGPTGVNPIVHSRTRGFGGFGTLTFDRKGRIVGVYSNGRKFQLELMDPYSLQDLARYQLPARPWFFLLQGVLPWEYIGAGTYFYLDHQNRAVVPTTQNTILVLQTPDPPGTSEFKLIHEYDISDHVIPMRWPKQDSLAWVLPDWDGEYYWYATVQGIVGTIDLDTGSIHSIHLKKEQIENSFAVGEDGVFIISDHAMYRFSQNGDGIIRIDWRKEYDRGSHKKPGLITRGSGSSVTLVGGIDGFVAITDNAEPRIQLLFLRRTDGEFVCIEPLFEEGRSATDISVIGFQSRNPEDGRDSLYTAVIENNWGHSIFPSARPEPGITRVDLIERQDRTTTCSTIWTSPEKNIGVFKMSLESGLIYTYFRDDSFPQNWYLTALDFRTGQKMFNILTGTGLGYNNWAGALFLHPDGGTIYSTTIFGLVMIQDNSH